MLDSDSFTRGVGPTLRVQGGGRGGEGEPVSDMKGWLKLWQVGKLGPERTRTVAYMDTSTESIVSDDLRNIQKQSEQATEATTKVLG